MKQQQWQGPAYETPQCHVNQGTRCSPLLNCLHLPSQEINPFCIPARTVHAQVLGSWLECQKLLLTAVQAKRHRGSHLTTYFISSLHAAKQLWVYNAHLTEQIWQTDLPVTSESCQAHNTLNVMGFNL